MSAILVAFAAWLYGRTQAARLSGRSGPGWAGLAAAVLAGLLTVWQLAQIDAQPPAQVQAADGRSLAGTWPRPAGSPRLDGSAGPLDRSRQSGRAAPDVAAPAGGGAAGDPAGPEWQPWSAQKVSQARLERRPVLVDFTAAWCISCQANKKLVLDRQAVREAFAADGVVLLRADWTSRDPAITAELARFGRNGVPLYLVYHPDQELPLMLPELLTVDVVLAALAQGR
jgi:thiol:disulfide interchange protein